MAQNRHKKNISPLFATDGFFSQENIGRNIPFILFLAGLAVFYIWNTYSAERMSREINNISKELKELRWYYVSAKSDLMFRSKQSEVAKAVESQGLKENITPPKKIVILKNEH